MKLVINLVPGKLYHVNATHYEGVDPKDVLFFIKRTHDASSYYGYSYHFLKPNDQTTEFIFSVPIEKHYGHPYVTTTFKEIKI